MVGCDLQIDLWIVPCTVFSNAQNGMKKLVYPESSRSESLIRLCSCEREKTTSLALLDLLSISDVDQKLPAFSCSRKTCKEIRFAGRL